MDRDPVRDRLRAVRPELDKYVVAVMRARTCAELFGSTEPVRVGRYDLRRHVGTGGGGSVFVAWDGELAREVALKIIATPDASQRTRALAEGQALAQLSHPNIVPVFDVGELDQRVYLVMELVRGVSLRVYARDASRHQIVRAYRQCALGLAAAHAANLVHRDFKPDNAVIAEDGRVRVIDFGLALARATRVGTPRYMAPEQVRGDELTAAVDQYALAVSLREALGSTTGSAGRVLARAMAESPRDRFASMAALEQALAALDPVRRWRRRAFVVAPLAIAAVAYGIGSANTAEEPCSRDGLADVWSPARHARLAGHFRSLGEYGAAATAQLDTLDAYARQWRERRHAACVAHRDGELSAVAYDRWQACSASARTQLAELAELAGAARADGLANVVRAIPELPDLASCGEATTVAAPTLAQEPRARALRERLDRERTRAHAGGDATALTQLVTEGRALGYRPLLADALLVLGSTQLLAWKLEAAEAPLHEAYVEQLRAGNYRGAVEAFARYAWVRSRREAAPRPDALGSETVVALAEGLPRSARFEQALLHNNLGSIAIAANDVARARTELEAALALAADVTGPGAVELSAALSNLALVTGDPTKRQALFGQRIAILDRALGADHALALSARMIAALALADPVAARRGLAGPCDRLALLHPEARGPITECAFHRGWLALAAGDTEDARRHLELAAARFDDRRPTLASAYLALASGDRATAKARFHALLASAEPRSWFELFDAGQAELGLAMAGDATASPRARALLERARLLHPHWSPIAWRLALAR